MDSKQLTGCRAIQECPSALPELLRSKSAVEPPKLAGIIVFKKYLRERAKSACAQHEYVKHDVDPPYLIWWRHPQRDRLKYLQDLFAAHQAAEPERAV